MAVGTCPFVRARERRAALGWELAVCTAVGQQGGKWGAVSIKATLQLLRKAEEAAGMVAVCRGVGSREQGNESWACPCLPPSCLRAGGLAKRGPVTPAVRDFEILLLMSAGDGQGRLELSDCFFQATGQHPPGRLLFSL